MANNKNYTKFIPVLISAAAAVLCTAFFRKKKSGHEQEEDAPENELQVVNSTASVEGAQRNSSSIRRQISHGGQAAGRKLEVKTDGRLMALFTKVSTIREELDKANEALSNTRCLPQCLEMAKSEPQEQHSASPPSLDFLTDVEPDSSEDWCSTGSSEPIAEIMRLPPPAKLTNEDKHFFLSTLGAGVSDGPYVQALPEAKPVQEHIARNINARMNAIRLCAFEGAQLSTLPVIDPNCDAWTPALEATQRASAERRDDEQPRHTRQKVVYDLDDI